jgi:2-iminobutanoate/2-iminopropanoate deaminase
MNYGVTEKMAFEAKTRNLILALVVTLVTGIALYAIVAPQYQHPVKTILFTKKAPEPIGPYSQGVQNGDYVFVSGQIGLDPVTGNLPATVDGQTVQAMENLKAILLEAGLDFTSVVQTRIYLTDMQDFNTVNGVYQQYFEGSYPARATVQVAGLPKGAKVEIEMMAKRQ